MKVLGAVVCCCCRPKALDSRNKHECVVYVDVLQSVESLVK